MRPRHLLWASATAATLSLGYCAADLTVLDRGLLFTGPDGEQYRVRPKSWVTRVTGSDATTIYRTVHLAWPRGGRPAPSSYLVAHEFRHIAQRKEGPDSPLFEIRYVLQSGFRDGVETDGTSWGMQHRHDAHFVWVSAFLRDRVVVR